MAFTGELMYAITTNGSGGIMLENEEGTVLQRAWLNEDRDPDEDFVQTVVRMLKREMHDQYAR